MVKQLTGMNDTQSKNLNYKQDCFKQSYIQTTVDN